MRNNKQKAGVAMQNSDEIVEMSDGISSIQDIRNEVAIRVLENWTADNSGYDEKIWDNLRETIEEHKLSDRRKFDD